MDKPVLVYLASESLLVESLPTQQQSICWQYGLVYQLTGLGLEKIAKSLSQMLFPQEYALLRDGDPNMPAYCLFAGNTPLNCYRACEANIRYRNIEATFRQNHKKVAPRKS